MWFLIVALLVLTVVAMVIGKIYYHRINKKIARGELTEVPDVVEADAECCGQHETCEKDSLLAAVSKGIEYYDDEELDRFRGWPADAYNEAEVEEFREVLYTLQEIEVAGWLRSLQLREINLPDDLKDEAFLIVGERRIH